MQQGAESEQGYIPDAKDDEAASGLLCFFNGQRECGPDCMAFTPQPANVQAFSPQQRHCTVLVGVERLARHVAIGVNVVSEAWNFVKKTSQDRARTAQQPPPEPR